MNTFKKNEIHEEEAIEIIDSVNFIKTIQSKYPLACSILEICRNWNLFINNWFNNSSFAFFFNSDKLTKNETNQSSITIDEVD